MQLVSVEKMIFCLKTGLYFVKVKKAIKTIEKVVRKWYYVFRDY